MASPGMFRSPSRVYVDRTRSRVVPEDSPLAAHLLVGENCEIPLDVAARYGLLSPAPQPAQAPEPPPLAPEPVDGTTGSGTPPEENVKMKAQRKPADKSVHGPVEDK